MVALLVDCWRGCGGDISLVFSRRCLRLRWFEGTICASRQAWDGRTVARHPSGKVFCTSRHIGEEGESRHLVRFNGRAVGVVIVIL